MPDPALLELIQHLAWQPPAIVRPAVTESASGMTRAFEQFVVMNEREVDAWAARGLALRKIFWDRAVAGEAGFSLETLGRMVATFEDALRAEAREIRRIRRDARRDERDMTAKEKREAKPLNDRLVVLASRFFDDGLDFALFLRALRAEMDPESRGGPSFEDADELERFLLSAVV